jgi:hypothetical protein
MRRVDPRRRASCAASGQGGCNAATNEEESDMTTDVAPRAPLDASDSKIIGEALKGRRSLSIVEHRKISAGTDRDL